MRNRGCFMQFIQVILCSLALVFVNFYQAAGAEPIMCDLSQKIPVNIDIIIEDPVLQDLQKRGVEKLTITPTPDFFWGKSFPLESEPTISFYDEADVLTLAFENGLLVTYSKGCGKDVVYAYCQMDGVDLKGEFPKDVKLHLSPILGQCRIEVCSTQCP